MDTPELPSFTSQIIGLALRHVMTGLGAVLAGWGIIAKSDQDVFVHLACGIVLALLGIGWSVLSKLAARYDFGQALRATPPGMMNALQTKGRRYSAEAPEPWPKP